jgi:sulfur-oxidizing protein SoxY
MQRRKFLSLGIVTTLVVPFSLGAIDYRVEKPKAWTANKVDSAIKALYGDVKPTETKEITLKTPRVAAGGSGVKLGIKSSLKLNSLAIFQDVNPEATVAVFTVHDDVNYDLKVKMAKSGTVIVVGEGQDGEFYMAAKKVEVAQTSCEG